MSYLIKNKKYTFMIIFFICSFFFIGSAEALVYKQDIGLEPYFNSRWKHGTVDRGQFQEVKFELGQPLVVNQDYDFIGIQLTYFDFTYSLDFNIENPYLNGSMSRHWQCTQGTNGYCTYAIINDQGGSFSQDLYGSYSSGDVYSVYAIIKDGDNVSHPTLFTSENEGYIFIPTANITSVKEILFYIRNHSDSTLNYYIEIDNLKAYFNYDSTEIVNALLGVNLSTQNTTSAIQQQTQQQAQQNAYVQSSNISQAQTNTTQSITVLNDSLTQELSQFSDLTQLVVAPITMFMELNNNVCAPLTLQIPFVNQTAVLPCIKPIMTQYFGGMYSVFTTVIGAILCYWTFVKTVALIKDLVDADNDKIEVVDL